MLSKHCSNIFKLKIKSESMVMGVLAILGGTVSSFRQLPMMTHVCATEHSKFFLLFVQKLSSIADKYIYLPRDEEELHRVMGDYEEVGLPGAVGSMDVVHVKWSNCPAGDFNQVKGKESYPSLVFQCISHLSCVRTSIWVAQ